LRFPEDPHLTFEAKDLIYRLLCDVDNRLGTRGAQEIKVDVHLIIIFCCNAVSNFLFERTKNEIFLFYDE
jgi:hypothetical protein